MVKLLEEEKGEIKPVSRTTLFKNENIFEREIIVRGFAH